MKFSLFHLMNEGEASINVGQKGDQGEAGGASNAIISVGDVTITRRVFFLKIRPHVIFRWHKNVRIHVSFRDLDIILRRISDIKNIAGVVVVNSDGVTVKSTLDNTLTAMVSE